MARSIEQQNDTDVYIPCGRCGDQGYLRVYSHVANGSCFKCYGAGGYWIDEKTERRNRLARERYAAKKEQERLAKVAERDARLAEFKKENAEFIGDLDLLGKFGESLKESLHTYGRLTGNQVEAAEKAINGAKVCQAEKDAEVLTPAPEGRHEIAGEVLAVRTDDTQWGVQFKMLVKDDRGFKTWGSVPKAIITQMESLEALKGGRVAFTARITQSQDDATFAFFSRPSKATLEG